MVKRRQADEFNKYEIRGAYHWEWYRTNHLKYRDLVDLALNYFPDDRGASVLDVGCGDGLTSYKLYQKGLSVIGIDTSAEAIRLAREKTNSMRWLQPRWLKFTEKTGVNLKKLLRYRESDLRFRVQSIYGLDPNDRYDYVLCHDVIEHVRYPEKLIERIYEVMRKFAIFSTPNGDNTSPKRLDYFIWKPQEFVQLFDGRKVQVLYCDEQSIYVKMQKY